MNKLIELIKIAKVLDDKKMFKTSDKVMDIVYKHVYAQYSGPQGSWNIPLNNRVIPWKDLETEYQDAEQKRLKYNPRLTPKEFESDPVDETEDLEGSIFSLNGQPVSGITGRDPSDIGKGTKDPNGTGATDDFTIENIEKNQNNKGYPTYANL